jgi:hypothetical protein
MSVWKPLHVCRGSVGTSWFPGGVSLRSRFGLRVVLIHVAIVAVFGVALPWMRGIEFLDSVMLAAYACLGVLFAAPAAAQACAAEPPASIGAAVGRIALAVAYGEGMAVTILLAGFLTVYLTSPHVLFAPDLETVGKATALGIAASAALGAIAAWITLQFSAGTARIALRVIFLGLLWLFFSYSRWLPDIAGRAAMVCVGIAAAALLALQLALRSR